MTVEILRELDSEPQTRVKLLNGVIEFTERHEITDRMLWWRERATTLLAEHYCVQGNRQEADCLYAEVRSLLPEDSDHDLVGWCKSWCDRHEARQLMEKGDWDAAYEKILQARVGTIDYGHRNLSKGLTMERILRMSAEIAAQTRQQQRSQRGRGIRRPHRPTRRQTPHRRRSRTEEAQRVGSQSCPATTAVTLTSHRPLPAAPRTLPLSASPDFPVSCLPTKIFLSTKKESPYHATIVSRPVALLDRRG